jgi:hypothetical protein
MADPAISLLIENYAQKYPSARPHYLFLGGVTEPKLTEISKRLRKLFVINYDTANNHAELPTLIEKLAEEGLARRKELFAQDLTS